MVLILCGLLFVFVILVKKKQNHNLLFEIVYSLLLVPFIVGSGKNVFPGIAISYGGGRFGKYPTPPSPVSTLSLIYSFSHYPFIG